MTKLDKEFKIYFNELDLTQEKQETIKNNIRIKYKRHRRNRNIIMSILIILTVAVISTGTLYAGDVLGKETTRVSKIFYKTDNDGSKAYKVKLESKVRKELNYDAVLNEPTCSPLYPGFYGFFRDCFSLYTYEEIEDILGVRLVKSNRFRGDKLALINIIRNDQNKIEYLDFRIPNYYFDDERRKDKKEEFGIDVSAMIKTKYSKNSSSTLFEMNVMETDEIQEYYLSNIGVTAYVVSYHAIEETYTFFEYDNVVYKIRVMSKSIRGNDLIIEETKKILDSIEK